ncbi:MAG: hypothetical protein SPiTSB_28890 [Shewanella algae]
MFCMGGGSKGKNVLAGFGTKPAAVTAIKGDVDQWTGHRVVQMLL